jgi:hypothetical protein
MRFTVHRTPTTQAVHAKLEKAMASQNFMGRIDIPRSADAAANEPYVVIAQIDYEAQDNVQTIRVPVSALGKLQNQLQEHLLGSES